VALVAVLLLVAGLIAIATAVVTLSAAHRRSAQRSEESEQRRVTLDSALRIAVAEIAYPKPGGPFWLPRQARTLPIGDSRVQVTLERESGRIDLNSAEEKYLVAALAEAGLDDAASKNGAARILDWIDSDDEVRPGGAEAGEYQAAGLPHEPRNSPMETVEEVRQVIGLHSLRDETLSVFTVYSQMREPSRADAPQPVQQVIEWLDRAAAIGGQNSPPAAVASVEAGAVSYVGSVVRIRACVTEVRPHCRETVLRLTGNESRPVLYLAWR
jgi:general secretion pathway protein K